MRLTMAVLLFLGAALPLRAADDAALRWRLDKGQVLKYRLRHGEVRTVMVGDQKFTTTTDANGVKRGAMVVVGGRIEAAANLGQSAA